MINIKDENRDWKNVNWSQVAETLRELMLEAQTVEESSENGDKK